MSKRKDNNASIICKFYGATNYRGSRVKLTQSNSKESMFIAIDHYFNDGLDQIMSYLDKCDSIKDYRVIIDNTQQKYYTISFTGHENRIDNVLLEIKSQLNK